MFFNRSWGIAVMLASAGLAAPAVANTQMPPVEGPWAPSDYVEAIFAVQNGRITLPRRGNSKTEAIFDRLIDRGNIDQLMAGAESAAKKRQQILLILSATGEFRGRYGYAVALGDDVQNELIDIQIFRLALIDQLAALGVPDEAAWRRCTSAIATTLHGTLDTLAEAVIFTSDQRQALAMALARHYPKIRASLSPDEDKALAGRLASLARAETEPRLKKALEAALTAAGQGN
ncbi:MAG: hypothetical protein ACOZAM_33425 [Pseudomonadota bacterium]